MTEDQIFMHQDGLKRARAYEHSPAGEARCTARELQPLQPLPRIEDCPPDEDLIVVLVVDKVTLKDHPWAIAHSVSWSCLAQAAARKAAAVFRFEPPLLNPDGPFVPRAALLPQAA